jgi:hypothetical protein
LSAEPAAAVPPRATDAPTGTATWGWRILIGVAGLLVVNGLGLYAFIVDTHVEQTIGVLLAAFGAVSLVVAVEGLRRGSRWAWHTMWVVIFFLVVIGAHTLRGDRLDVPLTYLGLGAVALAGQLLARRSVSP